MDQNLEVSQDTACSANGKTKSGDLEEIRSETEVEIEEEELKQQRKLPDH